MQSYNVLLSVETFSLGCKKRLPKTTNFFMVAGNLSGSLKSFRENPKE